MNAPKNAQVRCNKSALSEIIKNTGTDFCYHIRHFTLNPVRIVVGISGGFTFTSARMAT